MYSNKHTNRNERLASKVTFSGNSAVYSEKRILSLFGTDDLVEVEKLFSSISHVKFNSDYTLSIYHYGKLNYQTMQDLKCINYILDDNEKLIAFGFDYTNMRPLLIILDNYGVKIVPYKIKVGYTRHSTTVNEISETIPIDMGWTNHKRRSDFHYPALLSVIEPDNWGYEINDENETISSEQSEGTTPNKGKEA